jgi:hypothetical protein
VGGPGLGHVSANVGSPRNVTFAKSGERHILAGWQRPADGGPWTSFSALTGSRCVTGRTGSGGGGDGRAGRMMAVIAAGAFYRYRVRWFTVGSCSSEKSSSGQSTATQRANGASWRRGTRTSSSVSPRPSFRLATDSSASAAASRRAPGADPVTFVSYLIEEGDPLEVVIPGSRTCSAPGPRSRSRCRHHDRDAARQSSVSSARPSSAQARASRQKSPAVRH